MYIEWAARNSFALISSVLMAVTAFYIILSHILRLRMIRLLLHTVIGAALLFVLLLVRARVADWPEMREFVMIESQLLYNK